MKKTKKRSLEILKRGIVLLLFILITSSNMVFGRTIIEGKTSTNIKENEEEVIEYKVEEDYYIQISRIQDGYNKDVVEVLETKTDTNNYNIARLKLKAKGVGNTDIKFRVMYANTKELSDELRYKTITLNVNVVGEVEYKENINVIDNEVGKINSVDAVNEIKQDFTLKKNEQKNNNEEENNEPMLVSSKDDLEENSNEEEKEESELEENKDNITYEELEKEANKGSKRYLIVLSIVAGLLTLLLIWAIVKLYKIYIRLKKKQNRRTKTKK